MTTVTAPLSPRVRRPAVAGMFYPADARVLRRDLGQYLAAVPPGLTFAAPKAIIVPHAGYMYSAPVAAHAYARLGQARATIRRVVLLGPCHRVAVRGLAVPTVDAFATPLGEIPLDRAAIDRLDDLPQVVANDAAHAEEHSLEVQLPFLQDTLDEFTLVPLAVGQCTAAEVAQVIDRLWGGPETLIVISSDLSHYHPYAEAQKIDGDTAGRIAQLQQLTSFEQACGALPVNGLLAVARKRGLAIDLLDLRNSGDTAGDRQRVVGYAAFALGEAPPPVLEDLGTSLLRRARNAIAGRLGLPPQPEASHPELAVPGATFVTLMLDGALRGCIGSLEAHRDLGTDVRENAVAAAFRDPRFSPLEEREFPRIRVEVSLLTPAQPMQFSDEADALRQLRPGVDGVILEAGRHRATFLPQVWEQLPDPVRFMAQLKQKAGLAPGYWSPEVRLSRYQVNKWKEPDRG